MCFVLTFLLLFFFDFSYRKHKEVFVGFRIGEILHASDKVYLVCDKVSDKFLKSFGRFDFCFYIFKRRYLPFCPAAWRDGVVNGFDTRKIKPVFVSAFPWLKRQLFFAHSARQAFKCARLVPLCEIRYFRKVFV